ncbi:TPA: hypothetical protein ACTPQ1_004501 [Salmonella enterica]
MLFEIHREELERDIEVSVLPFRLHGYLSRKFVYVNGDDVVSFMVTHRDQGLYEVLYPHPQAAFYTAYGWVWPSRWSSMGTMYYNQQEKRLIIVSASRMENMPLDTFLSGIDLVQAVAVSLSGVGIQMRMYHPKEKAFTDDLALLEQDLYDRMQIRVRFSTFRGEHVPRYREMRKQKLREHYDLFALEKLFTPEAGFDPRNVEIFIPVVQRWIRLVDIGNKFTTLTGQQKYYHQLTLGALRTD